jgi:hypothetical protein
MFAEIRFAGSAAFDNLVLGLPCDDDDVCTSDSCDESGVCRHVFDPENDPTCR